jgi:hypothetical protein
MGHFSPLNVERHHEALFDVVEEPDVSVETTLETVGEPNPYPSTATGQLHLVIHTRLKWNDHPGGGRDVRPVLRQAECTGEFCRPRVKAA